MYRIKGNIICELIDKEVVIVDANNGRFLNTNLTGYCIIKAIENQYDLKQICNELSERFQISLPESETIVANFIELLETNDIIEGGE